MGRVDVRPQVLRVLHRCVVAGLLRLQRRLGIVEQLPRHELAPVQRLGALMRLLRLLQLRRRFLHLGCLLDWRQLSGLGGAVPGERARERGTLLVQAVLRFLAVELDEGLAGAHAIAKVGEDPADRAVGFRRHHHFVGGRQRADDVDTPTHDVFADFLYLHGRRRAVVRARLRSGGLGAGGHGTRDHRRGDTTDTSRAKYGHGQATSALRGQYSVSQPGAVVVSDCLFAVTAPRTTRGRRDRVHAGDKRDILAGGDPRGTRAKEQVWHWISSERRFF